MERKDIISTFISTILIFGLCFFGALISANAQTNYKIEGNTFSKIEVTKSNNIPEKTDYLWKDSKGKEYPIYISATGSCYVIRISNKTGKEYKQYMPVEVSEKICSILGREYKSRTNNKK